MQAVENSQKKILKELDMAIVLLHNGIFRAVNDYHANRYGTPKMDEVQNFKIHAENTTTDERTHIQLSRKITTDDEKVSSLKERLLRNDSKPSGSTT